MRVFTVPKGHVLINNSCSRLVGAGGKGINRFPLVELFRVQLRKTFSVGLVDQHFQST